MKPTPFDERKYLIPEEVDALTTLLLKYHLPERLQDYRDTTMLLVLLFGGMRAQEFLNLRPVDLMDSTRSISINSLKQGRDRIIPLAPWLFAAMKHFASLAPSPMSRIFNIKYNRLRDIWQNYRPVNKKLHALRHTFAIRNYLKTKDMRLIMHALGHKSASTTQIYLDYMYSLEEMRKLILD